MPNVVKKHNRKNCWAEKYSC